MQRLLRIAALICGLWPAVGLGWDTAALLPPGEMQPPAPAEAVRLLPDGGAWISGWNGELVRVSGGRAIRAEHPSWFGVQRTSHLADTTADGGALVYGEDCRVLRYSAEGRVRWRSAPACLMTALAATDDSSWGALVSQDYFAPAVLRHLAADGTELPLPPETLLQLAPSLVEPNKSLFRAPDGGVLHAGAIRGESGLAQVRVVRLDSTGRVLWRWQSEGGWAGAQATATPDGGLLVSGCVPSPGAECGILQIVRLSPEGQVRWFNRTLPVDFTVALSPIATSDGGAAILTGTRNVDERVVVRLASDGRIAWQQPVGALFNHPVLGEADDGGIIAAGVGLLSFDERGLRFVSLDPEGRTRADRYLVSAKPITDGNTLLLANPTPPRLVKIDKFGESVLIEQGNASLPTEMDYAASASGSDGSEFVLAVDRHASYDRLSPHFTLSKVGPDGRFAWQRDTADEVVSAQISANAQRVCSVTLRSRITAEGYGARAGIAECFDAATGATLWSREVTSSARGASALAVLRDNRVVIVFGGDMMHTVQLLDTDGRPQQTTYGHLSPVQIATSPNGHMAIILNSDSFNADSIVVYGPDAQQRYLLSKSVLNFAPRPLAITVSDDAAMAAYGFDSVSDIPGAALAGAVYTTDPVTQRSWRTVLPPLQDNGGNAKLAFAGNTLLLAQRRDREGSDTFPEMRTAATRLTALDRAGGSVRWQQDSINVSVLRHAMAPSADGNRLVSVHGDRYRLRVEQYDWRTGTRVYEGWRDCAALECDPVRLVNGSDGRSRLVSRVQTAENGSGVAVYTERGFDTPPTATRLDQTGIAGAWWSPYANGEGIVFDWLPASRTVFAAWFTYAPESGNHPSQLRWYTLQANQVDVQATTLELPILETAGGNFDAGPAVAPQRVGTARVTFSDCRNATLQYSFDAPANAARSGTITLSRLSPATQPCLLADGTTQPADSAQPPANGFDARQSGTWFEAATPGQGLQFTVQPNGVFFAPWFTFDRDGAANDPTRQHWFTLQGNLAEARDGAAELVIVQTIGGAFDREATYNAYAVGSAALRMLGCDRATLDYRFDDRATTGPYRSLTGTLDLTRASGCAP